MNWHPLPIAGTGLIEYDAHTDMRGEFVKFLHQPTFASWNLTSSFPEGFYSISGKNVLRGMHLQVSPQAQDKIVQCLLGSALDVFVDLRASSPTFRHFHALRLEASIPHAIYLPQGIAHGFLSLEDHTLMHYLVSAPYAKECDTGIRWDSFGFDWNAEAPVVSTRDQTLPTLSEFTSVEQWPIS